MGVITHHRRPALPKRRATAATTGERWRVFSPILYRYMNAKFVDAFFADGSLRLSTFAKCKQHSDEQRQDVNEGSLTVVVTDPASSTVRSVHMVEGGANAFILCGTLWHNAVLMKDFHCDSYIRIHDPAEFGMRIAKHIPGFSGGGEGPCIYHHLRIIEASASHPADAQTADDADPQNPLVDVVQHYPLFLKHKSFSHQAEYRLIWMTDAALNVDYIDIRAPEVRELCSPPGSFELEQLGQESR